MVDFLNIVTPKYTLVGGGSHHLDIYDVFGYYILTMSREF